MGFLQALLGLLKGIKKSAPSRSESHPLTKHKNRIPQAEQTPKKHPPPPTPLDFPACTSKGRSPGFFAAHIDLFSLFALLRKLDDINAKHIKVLNIKLDRDVPLRMLMPKGYLPLPSWETDPAQSGGSNVFPAPLPSTAILSNGFEVPGHVEFYTRMKELMFENDDVFRFIKREPNLPGRPTIKVAQFRKFFEALYAMAEYWDTSLDDENTTMAEPSVPTGNDAMDIDQLRSEAQQVDTENGREPYTGRRIGTGRDMPRHYREDAVKFFVETIAWCFRCQVQSPRNYSELKLKSMLLPVHQTALVYRPVQDRPRARQGFVEGPLMGVQCRAETVFRMPGEKQGEAQAEMVDLLREVGAMLLLAQERAREGQTEVVPGTDQWWTMVPRWGGGPGGEIGSLDTNTDNAPPLANEDEAINDGQAPQKVLEGMDDEEAKLYKERLAEKKRKIERSTERTNKRAQRAYKDLEPPAGKWDKKTTYSQIGKQKGSEYDDLYMVSSINHHVSIIHLRIHTHYLEYLTTGKVTVTAPASPHQAPPLASDQPWYGLDMQRSRWYNLLEPADRVQAMRGIWGVMAWLMRDGEGADM
ncbi:hypothetical protein MMC08_000690 [Hypocenomyce scalaris]|nr:hypothetical protein [Hypocenomyce scalaris]